MRMRATRSRRAIGALEPYEHAGAVLFVPNSAGCCTDTASRTSLGRPGSIRPSCAPSERAEFEHDAARVSFMIRCYGADPTKAFSPSIAELSRAPFSPRRDQRRMRDPEA